MKTFFTALVLMALVIGFVIWNAFSITGKIDELLLLAESFPKNAEDFEAKHDVLFHDVEKFYALWDKAIPRLAFTSGYDNLNRADSAAILLYASYQNRCAADFVAARYDFYDALSRLRELESFRLLLLPKNTARLILGNFPNNKKAVA